MPQPHTHLYEVAISADTAGASTTFRMPGWTPGSYLVREYARHVQDVTAVDEQGSPLGVEKIDKAGWTVHANTDRVTLKYRVYAHDLTVRTSHLDGTHGYFNGANVFMSPDGQSASPATLEVSVPEGWTVSVALPRVEEGKNIFRVVDFDELVDSPVECGTHEEHHFEAAGVTHRWASWGDDSFDITPLLPDVTTIIEEEVALFGELPEDIDDYLFIAHVQERRNGGLEHKKSQTLGIDRRSVSHMPSYEDFVCLVTHEYFHLWNVKRIRPVGLGPFDYNKENYTPLLWMMEGFTGYYDTLLPIRAGLIPVKRYFEVVGERIGKLRSVPGRHVRSLEESSFDAWVKLYRPDENTGNSVVSYYLKGEMAAWLLDLTIRRETDGERSLDDVMRFFWHRQRDTGAAIDPADVDRFFQEATGLDLKEAVDSWARGRNDLPFEKLLPTVGLELKGGYKKTYDRRRMGEDEKAPAPWLGITTQIKSGKCTVATVRSDGPGYDAGVYAGDELIAINLERVSQGSWKGHLALYRPGDEVQLTLARRKQLVTVNVTLAEMPFDTFTVGVSSEANAAQRTLLEAWLGQKLD